MKPTIPAAPDEWVCVGHQSTFGTRTALKVHGRQVTVLRLKRRHPIATTSTSTSSSSSSSSSSSWLWTCLDSVCYHAGGPLMQGKLVNVENNRTCVSCPWHSYLVDVFTGEGLYLDLSRKYCSKGVRQRVHSVKVDSENDHVYVRLNQNDKEGSIQSDEYAYKARNFAHGSDVPTQSFPDW